MQHCVEGDVFEEFKDVIFDDRKDVIGKIIKKLKLDDKTLNRSKIKDFLDKKDDNINKIIIEYRLIDSPLIRKRLYVYLLLQMYHSIMSVCDDRITNYSLLEIIGDENIEFPKCAALSKWDILFLTYKTKRTSRFVGSNGLSSQYAKVVQMLSNSGWIFKRDQGNPGSNSYEYTDSDKNKCRQIVCFGGIDQRGLNESHICASKKNLQRIKAEGQCAVSGTRHGLILDHREPVRASIKRGQAPYDLSDLAITNGSYKEKVQFLSTAMNKTKETACRVCLEGKIIPVPPLAQAAQDAGLILNRFGKSCKNCFWFLTDRFSEFLIDKIKNG